MAYGELYIPDEWTGINPQNGQFLKGHIPHNKGKKWDDIMGKRAQKRAAKGWKNLETHRPKTRSDTSGRCRKQVVAVGDDGSWRVFSYIGAAAEWIGGNRENIARCCRLNHSCKRLKNSHGKMTCRVNTDHKCKGVRFYFEKDNVWTIKIKQ